MTKIKGHKASSIAIKMLALNPVFHMLLVLNFSFLIYSPVIPAADIPAGASPGGAQPNINTQPATDGSELNFRYSPFGAKKHIKTDLRTANVPRLKVKNFIFNGVTERPKHSLFKADIVEMGQRLIGDYPEGLAIDDFRELTDQVSNYYRERGFILARAYVPEQNINNHQVTINIIEGFLEQIVLNDSRIYSVTTLEKPFAELINKPVEYLGIESALLYAADSPGIQFQALFSPGQKKGGSILTLSTTQERRANTHLWLDNYGSQYTGSHRLGLSSTINNLSNSADYLSVTLLKTFNPSNSIYYALDYERPLNLWNSYLGFDINKNGFEVGQELEELGIQGDSIVAGVRLRKVFIRQRDENLFINSSLHQKSANSEQAGINIGEDKLAVASLSLHYNADSTWLIRGKYSGEIRYSQGLPDLLGAMNSNGNGKSSRVGSSGDRAGGDFSKINLAYSHWYPLKKNQVLKIQYRGQFSGDLLSSIEQSALGGPNSVRAYPVSEALVDNSTIINVEWQARSSKVEGELNWLKNFQFGAYYDFASGSKNQARANEREQVSLKGLGGFVEFQPFDKFQTRFDLAFPIGGDEATNGDSMQLYFNLGRVF